MMRILLAVGAVLLPPAGRWRYIDGGFRYFAYQAR